jgi:hypothetical protein
MTDGMVKKFEDYSVFVQEMEASGWYREQLSIDENNTFLVATFTATSPTTGRVAEVTCPAGRIVTTKGVEQIPAGADRGSAHAVVLRLGGTDDLELNRTFKVKIEKIKPSEETTMVARDFYSMFSLTKQIGTATVQEALKSDNEIYRWRRGVVLYGEEKMRFSVITPNITVSSGNVKIQMDLDLWTRRV